MTTRIQHYQRAAISGKVLNLNVYYASGQTVSTIQCAPIQRTQIPACRGKTTVLGKPLTFGEQSVVELLRNDGRFTKFAEALETHDLMKELEGNGFKTVMAPTDDVLFETTLGTEEIGRLIVEGQVCCAALDHGSNFKALTHVMRVTRDNADQLTRVEGRPVTQCDVMATDGVVHVLGATNTVVQPIETRNNDEDEEVITT